MGRAIHRIPVCSETTCINDGDENKLKFVKCKQVVGQLIEKKVDKLEINFTQE